MGIHDGHREKMRRRFRETGLEGFADHEALELLLYYAIPRRDTNPIAHALMDRYDSLSAVLNAPVEDLQKVEGIGESAAVLLSLVARISRKARLADAAQETVLNSSERAGTYLLERFSGETREQALVRECREELAVTVSVGEIFAEVTHEYPDLTVHLTLFHAAIAEGTPQMREHNDIRWITVGEIPQYDFCPADQPILESLPKYRTAKQPEA